MLLRRITEHIKAQNWFAVFLDFFIVVIGVFMGIQLGNWNAERQDNQRKNILLEKLEVGVGFDAWDLDHFALYNEGLLASALLVIDDLSGKAPLDDAEFLIAAHRASQFIRASTATTIYDELLATGGVNLVADSKIGQVARIYYSSSLTDEMATEGLSSTYRRLYRATIPIDVQLDIISQCGDRTISTSQFANRVSSLVYECSLTIPEKSIRLAANKLRQHPELVETLQLRAATVATQLNALDDQVRLLAPFKASLKELEDSEFY